jgi:hypothetical protein
LVIYHRTCQVSYIKVATKSAFKKKRYGGIKLTELGANV